MLESGVRVVVFFQPRLSNVSVPLAASSDKNVVRAAAMLLVREAEKKAKRDKKLSSIGRAKRLRLDLTPVLG
jgi:hypothetical protein